MAGMGAFSVLLLCLAACSGVLSDNHADYMWRMEAALNASMAIGITPDDEPVDRIGIAKDFSCPELSASVLAQEPENVHLLSPAHIQVVAAMGDSLSAAMGAKARWFFPWEIITEYRGVSFPIGGDRSISSVGTIPNIIKHYNPDVKGYSTGSGTGKAKYNVAVSGAKSEDMFNQAKDLVARLRNDNLEYDWKLVTVFIGGNDLCDYCSDNNRFSAESYVANIRKALDYLYDNLPRTFVSIIHTLDVTPIAALDGWFCDIVHFFTCHCAETDREETSWASHQYRAKLEELIETDGTYDGHDDFTVVIQPFPAGITEVPREGDDPDSDPDRSYFSPDCFHFSEKAHKMATISLWNNMLEPVGKKTIGWDPELEYDCPSEDFPYFYTNLNSQSFGGFGAQPPADPAASNNNPGNNLLGVLLGSGIGAFVVVVAITVAIIGTVWYRRRRQQRYVPTSYRVSCDNEKVSLLKD